MSQLKLRPTALTLATLLGLFLAPEARAEYVVLRNGQRIHVTGYQRVGEMVRLSITGGRVEVRASEIVAIEPEDQFPAPAARMPGKSFAELIRAAAEKHGVDQHLIASVIAAESDFDPRAVSRKQARGLMQLMPATAARFEVADVFDPEQNIDAGVRYLKELLERYRQNLALALAAYNAGPERVERHRGVPPIAETQAYVRRVTSDYQERKQQSK